MKYNDLVIAVIMIAVYMGVEKCINEDQTSCRQDRQVFMFLCRALNPEAAMQHSRKPSVLPLTTKC